MVAIAYSPPRADSPKRRVVLLIRNATRALHDYSKNVRRPDAARTASDIAPIVPDYLRQVCRVGGANILLICLHREKLATRDTKAPTNTACRGNMKPSHPR